MLSNFCLASSTLTLCPFRYNSMAANKPPTPAPTTRTSIPEAEHRSMMFRLTNGPRESYVLAFLREQNFLLQGLRSMSVAEIHFEMLQLPLHRGLL